MKKLERYDGLDILKTICAFMVVFAHAPIVGTCGEYGNVLARVSVPLFFMISGFFFDSVVSNKKEWKHVKKLLMLLLLSNLTYFLFNTVKSLILGNVDSFFHKLFSAKTLVRFFFLNVSPFSSHLWYLGAILYVYVLAVCYGKNPSIQQILGRMLPILIPVLLLGDLILGTYSLLLFGREFPYVIVRNFLFVGIPYFMIGVIMKNKEESLDQIRKHGILMVSLAFLFCLTTILERTILVMNDLKSMREHYISTTLLSLVLFIIFSDCSWNDGRLKLVKLIGRKHSLMIYVIHPLFITLIRAIMIRMGINDLYLFVRPVIVFIVSILFSVIFYFTLNLTKHRSCKDNSITEIGDEVE